MKQAKNFFWYLFSFGGNSFIQLISLWFFAKHLSKEDFGIYALIAVFGIITVSISNLGLLSVYQRNFFDLDDKSKEELLFSIISFIIMNLIIIILVTLFFFEGINIFFFKKKLGSFLWLLIGQTYFVFHSINQFFFAKLKNTYKAKTFSYLTLLEKSLAFGIALIVIIVFHYRYEAILLGQMCSVLILFFYFLYSNIFGKGLKFNLGLLKASLKLSIPLSPVQIVKVVGSQSDKYMISYFGNFSGLGVYDIALKLGNLSFVFNTALQNVFSPKVYQQLFLNDRNKLKRIGDYLTPFYFLTFLFSLIICLFVEEIIYFFLNNEFIQAIPIVVLFSSLYAIQFFTKQPQLLYAKKTKLLSVISFLFIVANIITNIPFIYYFGILGAAYSTIITGIVYVIVYHYYGQKFVCIEWEYRKIFLIFISYLFIITSILSMYFFEINYCYRLFMKITYISIFIFLGIMMKIVNKENLKKIFSQ